MKKSIAVKEIRAFNRFYTNVIGVMNRHFLDSPYSLTEVRIMFEIYYDEKATVRKIKNLLMVDEGYLSRTIDKLNKQGIVTKKQSKTDRRSYILSLTAKGKRIYEKIEQRQNALVRSMIDHLTEEELDELISKLQTIRSLLINETRRRQMEPTLDDINIRNSFRPGDIGYIIYLHGNLYAAEYNHGIEFETYVAEGLLEFYRRFDPQKDRVWICEHDHKIVGFLLLMHRKNNAAQLRYFLIHPEYRGIGLGKRLMELFMEFFDKCQYTSAYLWTTDELHAAASLYTRFGFTLTEEVESTAFGKPLIEQRYDFARSI